MGVNVLDNSFDLLSVLEISGDILIFSINLNLIQII